MQAALVNRWRGPAPFDQAVYNVTVIDYLSDLGSRTASPTVYVHVRQARPGLARAHPRRARALSRRPGIMQGDGSRIGWDPVPCICNRRDGRSC